MINQIKGKFVSKGTGKLVAKGKIVPQKPPAPRTGVYVVKQVKPKA